MTRSKKDWNTHSVKCLDLLQIHFRKSYSASTELFKVIVIQQRKPLDSSTGQQGKYCSYINTEIATNVRFLTEIIHLRKLAKIKFMGGQ